MVKISSLPEALLVNDIYMVGITNYNFVCGGEWYLTIHKVWIDINFVFLLDVCTRYWVPYGSVSIIPSPFGWSSIQLWVVEESKVECPT